MNTGAGRPERRRARRRLLLAFAGGGALLLVAIPAWRSLFDALERDGRLSAWVNRRPDRLRIAWSSIRSPWPGWIEVEGLRVAGRTPRMLWEVRADRASAAIEPHRLLLRELAWAAVRGEGLGIRIARFPAPGVPVASPAHRPRIEGFPDGPAPPPDERPAWSFAFRGVEVEEVREVWIDDRLYRGRGRGRGGFALRRRTTAEIFDTELACEALSLRAAGRPVAEAVDLGARFRVRSYPYRGARVVDVARRADGRLELEGTIAPDEVLSYLFGGWERLALESGASRVRAEIVLADGSLRPESRVRLSSPQNVVRFLGFEAAGEADLDARVVGDFSGTRIDSALELGSWTMGRPDETPLLSGDGMMLAATARSGRVDEPPSAVELSLELGDARIPDLGFLNELIPAAAGIAIERGEAAIGGTIRFATGAAGEQGDLRVLGTGLALRVGGERMSADLEARLRLSDADLAEAAFDLDGSRIYLRNFAADTSAGGRVAGWWGEIGIAGGRIRLERPASLRARFDARLRDTQPLVAFYEIYRDLPRWAERLLTVEAVSISGDLAWEPGRLRIENGFLPLAHGELRGEAELERASKRGRLLATWRQLVVGLELAGAERDLHLVGARDWWRTCCSGPSVAPADPR